MAWCWTIDNGAVSMCWDSIEKIVLCSNLKVFWICKLEIFEFICDSWTRSRPFSVLSNCAQKLYHITSKSTDPKMCQICAFKISPYYISLVGYILFFDQILYFFKIQRRNYFLWNLWQFYWMVLTKSRVEMVTMSLSLGKSLFQLK